MLSMSMRLNDEAMRQFTLAKIQDGTNMRKSSLDFSADGRRLLVCDPSTLTLISSSRQSVLCQVHMHHYSPEVACFAQPENRVLHGSSKTNYSIYCQDLNIRSVVRQFCGHSKGAHILSTQPANSNIFISAGRDDQVYMWDFRVPTHTYHLKKLLSPLCDYDPTGMTFATTSKSMRVDIHDVRKLGEKPRLKFEYNNNDGADWTQLQFSPDGKTLLLSTNRSRFFSLDALTGCLHQSFSGYCNEQCLPLKAAFTPDSQFVLSGDDHGQVYVWRASSGKVAALLRGRNVGPVRCLRFNPKATMFVSSNQRVSFWMPKRNGVYDWVEAPEAPEAQAVRKSKANPKPFPKPIMMPLPMTERNQPQSWLSIHNRHLKRRRMGPPTIDLTGSDDESELEDGEIRN
ncbi:WD repeat-containing protein 82 [Drosophila obscura]|uniref:WD repeat-containing protein 82 n=1 Tax=Drosophila obscura TaxID=7282 RepID=UPI001BB10EF1|nr:WD repeat-containing protein 82 [Drosophila obscura]